MPDDLSVAVERLRTSAQRLNALCDAAAQVIRDVEHFLEEARVGVSASVSLGLGVDDSEADQPDWEEKLWYCRLDTGKFRIAIVRHRLQPEPGEEDIVRAWSECTRDDKLDSLGKLPELLVELAKRVDERTAKAERAISTVSSLLQLPKKKKGAE